MGMVVNPSRFGAAVIATSYDNPGGYGDRRGFMSASQSGGTGFAGTFNNVLDGGYGSAGFFFNGSAAGRALQFDHTGLNVVIDEFTWYQTNGTDQGQWHWEVYDSVNAVWVTLSAAPFSLATGTITTISVPNQVRGLYHRLLGVSGNVSGSPDIQEVNFKIST